MRKSKHCAYCPKRLLNDACRCGCKPCRKARIQEKEEAK